MNNDSQISTMGLAAAVAASVLGGAVIVAIRAMAFRIDPVWLAALRYGIGAVLLVPMAMATGKFRIAPKDIWPIAGLGVLIFALVPYLLNLGMQFTSATRGAIAISTLPFMTALIAAALRIQRLTLRKLAGVVLAMIGVIAALSENDRGSAPAGAWIGDLVLLLTALLASFYNLLARPYMQRNGALTATTFAMLVGTLVLVFATLVSGQFELPRLSAEHWWIIAFLGVFGAAANFWLWSYALSHAPPTQVAITTTLSPLTAGVLGWGVLGEVLSLQSMAGLAAVVIGIAVTVRGRTDH